MEGTYCRHGTSYKDACNGFSYAGCPRTQEEADSLCYHGVKYGTRCGECECVRPAVEKSRDVALILRALEAAAQLAIGLAKEHADTPHGIPPGWAYYAGALEAAAVIRAIPPESLLEDA